ncbi:hypothetical protein FOZ62_011157, partial [Perkinsus olseni]
SANNFLGATTPELYSKVTSYVEETCSLRQAASDYSHHNNNHHHASRENQMVTRKYAKVPVARCLLSVAHDLHYLSQEAPEQPTAGHEGLPPTVSASTPRASEAPKEDCHLDGSQTNVDKKV